MALALRLNHLAKYGCVILGGTMSMSAQILRVAEIGARPRPWTRPPIAPRPRPASGRTSYLGCVASLVSLSAFSHLMSRHPLPLFDPLIDHRTFYSTKLRIPFRKNVSDILSWKKSKKRACALLASVVNIKRSQIVRINAR